MTIAAIILSAILSVIPARDTLRIPCVMVEFMDVKFSGNGTREYFDTILNEEGYSEGIATGSVRDYFRDNSLGAFTPVFDVMGPVTLSKYRAYYGRDVIVDGVRADASADRAIAEACQFLDPDVDFSVYDKDSDGILDMILYIYAGHDQSQGGPQDAIWSHNWNMSESVVPELKNVVLDGLRMETYFCSSELRGKEGSDLSGIGVISHEFGHALGLPDFYNQVASSGASVPDVGEYALMCYGMRNNFGFTPPYLTSEERIMLGWMERGELQELQPGKQILQAVKNNTAYIIPTETEGESFILEYRDSKGWDASLPEGLVVYHRDSSATYAQRWENWKTPGSGINDNDSHPCFYIVPSYNGNRESGNLVFPGLSGAMALEPKTWKGTPSACQITCIELTPDGLSVYAQFNCGPNVNGYVRNSFGEPIEGASLLLLEGVETVSDSDGHFYLPVPENQTEPMSLRVSAPGYRDYVTSVSLMDSRVVSVPVTLRRESDAEETTLSKYNNKLRQGYYNKAGIGAVRFTPRELAPYAGNVIKEIVFYPYLLGSFSGEIYVTVDIGPRRVLTKLVEAPAYGLYFRNSIDVSEEGIVIPEGEYVYIGYGSANNGGNSFFIGTVYPGEKQNSYWSPFSLEQSSWRPLYVEKADITMNLMLQSTLSEKTGVADLGELGYAYINPGKGSPWEEGDTFELEIVRSENSEEPQSVTWFYDGEKVSGDKVVLLSGHHVLEAELEYMSGNTETLRKEFSVK